MTSGIVSEAIFNFTEQKLDRNAHDVFLVLIKILESDWLSPTMNRPITQCTRHHVRGNRTVAILLEFLLFMNEK